MQTIVIPASHIQRRSPASPQPQAPLRTQPRPWHTLEVILKITERCNIACTYCYFFNMDDNAAGNPVYMDGGTAQDVVAFLAKAVRDSGASALQIDIHGGEPLLMKKERFAQMCQVMREGLGFVGQLRIALQTNAMLVDDEWIELFERFDISVAVSLDGPAEYHDMFRLDHAGKGTHAQVVAGLRKLQAAAAAKRIYAIGTICVPHYSFDARRVLSHFVDDLGQRLLHISLPVPGSSADHFGPDGGAGYTRFLCDLFTAWTEREDPSIEIRLFQTLLGRLLGGREGLAEGMARRGGYTAFTIQSDGQLCGPDDDRLADYAFQAAVHAKPGTSLDDFYDTPEMLRYAHSQSERSPVCQSCCWGQVCEGGDVLGGRAYRFVPGQGHANPSAYCQGLQELLVLMTQWALGRGVPMARIEEVLVTG